MTYSSPANKRNVLFSLTLPIADLNLKEMEVQFTDAQTALIRHAIESGRLHREEEAIQEALALWEERERRRLEILTAVDKAEASLARGAGRMVTTHVEAVQLASDVKRRGLARIEAEQHPR